MATNLGLDDELDAVKAKTGSSTGWATAVYNLLNTAFRSSANPFGDLAKQASVASAWSAGDIKLAAYSTAPSGWLKCDGAAVSRTTYATLYGAIGTDFGAGDGSTTFNVPDLRRRVPMGIGGTQDADGNGPSNTLGSSGGAEGVILAEGELPAHDHTCTTTGDHRHLVFRSSGFGAHGDVTSTEAATTKASGNGHAHNAYNIQGVSSDANVGRTSEAGDHTHTIGETGSGEKHGNVQPSLVVAYYIKT